MTNTCQICCLGPPTAAPQPVEHPSSEGSSRSTHSWPMTSLSAFSNLYLEVSSSALRVGRSTRSGIVCLRTTTSGDNSVNRLLECCYLWSPDAGRASKQPLLGGDHWVVAARRLVPSPTSAP